MNQEIARCLGVSEVAVRKQLPLARLKQTPIVARFSFERAKLPCPSSYRFMSGMESRPPPEWQLSGTNPRPGRSTDGGGAP